jgi:hypothetical protein
MGGRGITRLDVILCRAQDKKKPRFRGASSVTHDNLLQAAISTPEAWAPLGP